MNTQRRLYRSTQDRMFAGVCGGIAEYLEVDPTLVRLVFVALAFMGGPGPIIYIVLLLVVPENPGVPWKQKRDDIAALDEFNDEAADFNIPMPTDRPKDFIDPVVAAEETDEPVVDLDDMDEDVSATS